MKLKLCVTSIQQKYFVLKKNVPKSCFNSILKDVCVSHPRTGSQFPPASSPVLEQVLSARGSVYAQISWLRNGCWSHKRPGNLLKRKRNPHRRTPASSTTHLLLREITPRFFCYQPRDSSFKMAFFKKCIPFLIRRWNHSEFQYKNSDARTPKPYQNQWNSGACPCVFRLKSSIRLHRVQIMRQSSAFPVCCSGEPAAVNLGPVWAPGGVVGAQRRIPGRPEQVRLQPAALGSLECSCFP